MNLNEINKLTVNDVLILLLNRLVDFSDVPSHLQAYWFKTAPEDYDSLELHESLIKPTLKQFEDELLIYKAELTEIENERLRKVNLHLRWKIINDRDAGTPAFRALIDESNAAAYMFELIENKLRAVEAETLMQQIEAKDILIIKENADKKQRDDLISIGRKEKEVCDNVQFLLAGYISKVELTASQVTKLKSVFKATQEKIIDAKPKEVKIELEKLPVDEIITAEIKAALLKELI